MNATQWIQLVAPFVSVGLGLVFGGKWVKTKLPGIMSAVKADAPTIIKDVETIGGDIGKFLGAPAFAALKAPMELHLHSLTSQLQKSQILQVASSALGAFQADLSNLSKNQTGTAVKFVETELSKIGVTLTTPEILDALKNAQAAIDTLRGTSAYTNTQALDASLKQLDSAAAATSATPTATA